MKTSKSTKQILIVAGLIGGAYLLVQAGQGVEQGAANATGTFATTLGVAGAIGIAAMFLL
jgi:hypothetical protein